MTDFKFIFDNYLNNINGFDYSYKARILGHHSNKDGSITYGEPTADSCEKMIELLKDHMKLDGTETMIDLGSGIGKILIALHYAGYFKELYGIELLKYMADESKNIIQNYGEKFNKDISNIHIIQGSYLEYNKFNKFDLLISNTSTNDDLRINLTKKINKEGKNNAMVLSSISPFEFEDLRLLKETVCQWSWGLSTLFISKLRRFTKFEWFLVRIIIIYRKIKNFFIG